MHACMLLTLRRLQGNTWVDGSSGWAWVCPPNKDNCDTLCADGWDDADAKAFCKTMVRVRLRMWLAARC